MSFWDIYKTKKTGSSSGALFDVLLGNISTEPHKWIVDNVPYIFRKSANGADIWPTCYDEITGGSIVWNQLVADSGSNLSVTIPSGHKYYMIKGGSKSVGSSSGAAITDLTGGTDIVIDLTRMFGAAVADHLYSLEQATAGAGVAYFIKLGYIKPHYAYNAGELLSVSGLASRKITGKNLFNDQRSTTTISGITYQFNSDGSVKVSGKATATSYCNIINWVKLSETSLASAKGQSVTLSGGTSQVRFTLAHRATSSSETINAHDNGSGATTTLPTDTSYQIYAALRVYNGASVDTTIYPMIRMSSVSDTTYESYSEQEYPLDSTLTLRGVPKLDANNDIYYDGDTYESNGKVTRYWAERDYVSGDATDGTTMITDGSKTIYKLTTPTTEEADPFTNPQTVHKNGTEEYVTTTENGLVPIGHNTKYKTRVSL